MILKVWRNGIYVFRFISFSKITLRRGYKFDKFALTSVLPGDTSDFWNSSIVKFFYRFFFSAVVILTKNGTRSSSQWRTIANPHNFEIDFVIEIITSEDRNDHRVSAGLKFTSDILSKQSKYCSDIWNFLGQFFRHSFYHH